VTDISDWGDIDSQPDRTEPDTDDDRYDEYKDDLAMGYIYPDGTQREPDEPDWGAEEYRAHCEEAHGGKSCTCPPPEPAEWAPGDIPFGEAPF
jgi:hypothetical protein